MPETAFNTIAEVQRLRDAGFEQKQAEAITLSIHSGVTGGVATKADLEKVERDIGSEIKLVRSDLGKDLYWIRLIGGAILAVLILPWLTEPGARVFK